MRALEQSADPSQTEQQTSTGLGQESLTHGSLTKTLGIPSTSQLHSKRKSLPADLDVTHPRMKDGEVTGNNRERNDSDEAPTMKSKRRKTAHHQRSNTVGTGSQFDFQEHAQLDTRYPEGSLMGHHEKRASRLRAARALLRGRSDTTRTDYFRLKALGIDPETPLVPRTARKRPRADALDVGEKRIKITTSSTPGSRENASVVTEDSGTTMSLQPRSVAHEEGEEEDSDEALLRQMRNVRDTMSESISWFIAEGAKNQPAISKKPRPDSNETAKEKRLREFTSTPSRTEQRLRSTGAHGLLPKGWDAKSSWRDEQGKISTSSAPAWSEFGSASPSPLLGPGAADADAAGGYSGAKKAVKAAERAKQTTAAGSSVEDAIEL